MQRLTNPVPIFLDGSGDLVDGGFIFVGAARADPETDPIDVFLDQGLTQPFAQPLRTLGGVIVNGADPAFAYFAEADASMTIKDANGVLVQYVPSIAVAAVSYQPASVNLDALAAIAAMPYGRALLALANQAALQAAVGLPAALPLTGGTVTGNIVRGGAGGHAYAVDPAMTAVRFFFTAAGAADPTSQPGDVWIEGS